MDLRNWRFRFRLFRKIDSLQRRGERERERYFFLQLLGERKREGWRADIFFNSRWVAEQESEITRKGFHVTREEWVMWGEVGLGVFGNFDCAELAAKLRRVRVRRASMR